MHIDPIVAEKFRTVNQLGQFFRPSAYTIKDCFLGRAAMDGKQDDQRDVDDLIFEGEQWHPSSR